MPPEPKVDTLTEKRNNAVAYLMDFFQIFSTLFREARYKVIRGYILLDWVKVKGY